jgi:cytochrome o ubiquinol oxidase operon protein cyoD
MKKITLGFVFSLLVTFIAFLLAPQLGSFSIIAIAITAIVQLILQLVFFLHIGHGPEHESRTILLSFTAVIIGIVIGGTLWIMNNLEPLHMQSPTQTDIYQGGVAAPQNELH